MTDLQTSLIVIGIMIVGGVVCYNKWHEFRARKHVEKAFSHDQDDVLLKPVTPKELVERLEPVDRQESVNRQEPVFEQDMGQEAAPASGSASALEEPHVLDEEDPITSLLTHPELQEVVLPVDDQIDCVIPIVLEVPIRGEKLLPLMQTLRYVGNKPVHYMGLAQNASTLESEWQPITHGGVYTELQAGVQLANRSSALNELEYSELVVRLRQVADEINADPEIPDMASVMQSARVLYQFVEQHDARLGLSIRSNGVPWAVNTLLAVLERLGFDVRPDGRFVMQDPDGTVLYSLTTNEPVTAEYTSCLTLLLDVPRIAAHLNAFASMLGCARMLAKGLNGTIVDDGKQTLSDVALDEIAQQVHAFYDEMQAAGIAAGSPRALRLFV